MSNNFAKNHPKILKKISQHRETSSTAICIIIGNIGQTTKQKIDFSRFNYPIVTKTKGFL